MELCPIGWLHYKILGLPECKRGTQMYTPICQQIRLNAVVKLVRHNKKKSGSAELNWTCIKWWICLFLAGNGDCLQSSCDQMNFETNWNMIDIKVNHVPILVSVTVGKYNLGHIIIINRISKTSKTSLTNIINTIYITARQKILLWDQDTHLVNLHNVPYWKLLYCLVIFIIKYSKYEFRDH